MMSSSGSKIPPVPDSFVSALISLGITTGDPAGIGPEVSLRAAADPSLRGRCRMLLFGDAEFLRCQAANLGLDCDLFETIPAGALDSPALLPERGIVDIPANGPIIPGQGSRTSGGAAARNLLHCVNACRSGRLDAMVTAPLHKRYFNEAGYHFPGHTEFLAHLAGVSRFAMAFLTERLKVVLVTIHVPLRTAIEHITADAILEKLEILIGEFPRLGLPCRKVAVAGLNPHAGEAGLLGNEDLERIVPAIDIARARWPGVCVDGPLPADTLFQRAAQGEFDAVLALYHDQGLIPVKLLGFGEAANVTLGLPFVRTSVDHGTAFEIAGKGLARPDGMLTAIRWALRLTRK